MRPTSTAPSTNANNAGATMANSRTAAPRRSAIKAMDLSRIRMALTLRTVDADHGDGGGHRGRHRPASQTEGRDRERRGERLCRGDSDVFLLGAAARAAIAHPYAGRTFAEHVGGRRYASEAGGSLRRRSDARRVVGILDAVVRAFLGTLQHGRL